MDEITTIKKELKRAGNRKQAKAAVRYFKTGPGEYGEGDVFIGVNVPNMRKIASRHRGMDLSDISNLLHSKIHEERNTVVIILVEKYLRSDEPEKNKIYDFYLKNTKWINNWDLVDISAPKIVGGHLLDKPRAILYKLAKSKNLWERRIAILATFAFIDNSEYKDSLKIAEMLLADKHDLIHKAVGWMLREVGKKSPAGEESFLKKYAGKMPRTMLRYAIEKFPESKRIKYLNKTR